MWRQHPTPHVSKSGIMSLEAELAKAEKDMKELEEERAEVLGAIPHAGLSDLDFTPYFEFGGSDVEQLVPKGVDEFGMMEGLVAGTAKTHKSLPLGADRTWTFAAPTCAID